jgi:hypothetical protein
MSEAMLPRCARCVLVVCSERGRSERAGAHGEYDANYAGIGGLSAWQVQPATRGSLSWFRTLLSSDGCALLSRVVGVGSGAG